MEQQAILCLGAVTLLGCGAGLVGLHRGNPRLRGLNLMGSALFTGGLAAATLCVGTRLAPFQSLGSLLTLLAFILCHYALVVLGNAPPSKIVPSCGLLAVHGTLTLLQLSSATSAHAGLLFFSITLALELGFTALLVQKCFDLNRNIPARLTAGLLWFLVAFHLLRGSTVATSLLNPPHLTYWAETVTYGLLIAAGVGLGFCFFSMTAFSLTAELENLANTDPLTQLFNRRAFFEGCQKELVRSRREAIPFSMLLLDIDHFKQFNDTFGHQAGDDALRATARAIQNGVRGIDLVCRWGGEEFAIFLPNANDGAASQVAERICNNIRAIPVSPMKTRGKHLHLTASIGAASFVGAQIELEMVLADADTALYAAKRAGRDQVATAYPHANA